MNGAAPTAVEASGARAPDPSAPAPAPAPPSAPRRRAFRRALDIVLAGGLLLLTLPMLGLAALMVLFTSGRPVFYAHRRVGRRGRPFRCWKLRTMEVDAEARLRATPMLHERYVANGYKLPPGQDPRVTRAGRWLRRTYVDELPQLFNVLVGDMSLVGPRPVVEEELAEFDPDVALLLSLRPGLFGAWTCQGNGRPPYPERARLELDYARDPSLRRDVRILLRSVPVVLRGYRNGA